MENTKDIQAEEFSFTIKLDMEKKMAIVIYGGQSIIDFPKSESITVTCVGCGKVIATPINKLESFYHKCTR